MSPVFSRPLPKFARAEAPAKARKWRKTYEKSGLTGFHVTWYDGWSVFPLDGPSLPSWVSGQQGDQNTKRLSVGDNHEGHEEHEEKQSTKQDDEELASWVSETDG